jgi:hypothetical protein
MEQWEIVDDVDDGSEFAVEDGAYTDHRDDPNYWATMELERMNAEIGVLWEEPDGELIFGWYRENGVRVVEWPLH